MMIRNKKIIKILFLSLILLFCLHCKANSESNQAISSEKQSEISKVTAPEIKMAKGNTLIAFSKAKARYLVREQLARLDFPNDAIGETNDIFGNIVLNEEGEIISESSTIIVDMSTLKSDKPRRDNYLRNNALETSKYPEAKFIIEEIQGMKWPIGKNIGSVDLELIGKMTVHGVSKPLTWLVEGNVIDGTIFEGTAKTEFKFSYFDIDIPRLAFIISVEDRIRLEFDFIAEIKE